MTFAAPWLAAFTGLLAVPLLLLLYFLRLRRRLLRVPSTMLWMQTFEDVQANEPFQKLRPSILLFLQLLALLALLLALARPTIEAPGAPAARTIVVLDHSASMGARDVVGPDGLPRTRFETAQEQARQIINGRGDAAILLIASGARARAMSGFETRSVVLDAAIDAVELTDEESDLAAALELAGSLALDAGATDGDGAATIVVLSDGVAPRTGYREGFRMRGGDLRYVRIGPEPDAAISNVGVIALSARRDFSDPTEVVVFARFANAGTEPLEVRASLTADGVDVDSRMVTLPAAGDSGPGEGTVTFSVEAVGAVTLLVRHDHADALAADDTAAVVLAPPVDPRILIVTDGGAADPFLVDLLSEFEPKRLTVRPIEEAAALWNDVRAWDLVVFDRVSPQSAPPVPSLALGAAAPPARLLMPDEPRGRRVLTWSRQDPLLRHVGLDRLVYRGGALELPAGARVLARGNDGPVLGVVESNDAMHVSTSFALQESNWPEQVGVAVFLQNVLDAATAGGSGRASMPVRPGASIPAIAVATEVGLDEAGATTVPAVPGRVVTLPPVERAGLYRLRGAAAELVAVSVLSAVESDIRPAESLLVNARSQVAAGSVGTTRKPIGGWFLAAALLVLGGEWLWWLRVAR